VADKVYGQYCGLAKALDLVGERWTLLIIRELALGRAVSRISWKGYQGSAQQY
jgi:DNA-binding HxlR family transcriptional regulator